MTMQSSASNPIPGQTCGSCCFWRSEGRAEQGKGWGQCRRMPPTPPPIDEEKLVHVGIWPSTQETDWCGEWRGLPSSEHPSEHPSASSHARGI